MVSRRAAPVAGLAVCLFAAALLLQWADGAYGNDFGGNSDEAAHFVTAVMLRDFVLGGAYGQPLAFAKAFYLHYPKVAFGQWPPLLYVVLGGWMILFGASRAAALVLIAATAAGTSTLMVAVARPRAGLAPALLAGMLFLASPLVQESTGRVMTEQLVTLLALASAVQFARYADTGRLVDALWFGGLAALAILTRGSAWALALVPGLTILLTGRFGLLIRPALWLSALPVLILCVPWYAATTHGVTGTWAGAASGPPYWLAAVPFYATTIGKALGWPATGLALVGIAATLAAPRRPRIVDPLWTAVAALMAATLLLACAAPTGLDARFMVAVLPEAMLFAAAGLGWLARTLSLAWPRQPWSALLGARGLCALTAAGFLIGSFTLPAAELRFAGLGAAERRLAGRLSGPAPAILVISDEKGEGAAVAEAATAWPWQSRFILRGSKLLVREDWLGRGSVDRFPNPADLERLLADIPVSGILLDGSIPANRREAYQARVRDLVLADPQTWAPVGAMSVDRQGAVFADAARLYVRRSVPHAVDEMLLGRVVFDGLQR